MKSVALVSTQMQLINCVEFLFKYSKRIDLLVVLCHSESRCDQLKKMLSIPDICFYFKMIKFITITKQGLKGIFSQFACKKRLSLIARRNEYDECIVGNNFPVQNRFFLLKVVKKKPSCVLYVCDDGLASISSYTNRLIQLNSRENAYPINSKVLEFVYMFSGVKRFIPREFTYFSIYDLEDNRVDKYINNSYSFLRSHSLLFSQGMSIEGYDTVFLGQPLLQQRILNKREFNYYIQYVLRLSNNQRVLYVAHPQEIINKEVFYDSIRGQIDIVKLEYPIETLISKLESKNIYSFYTSALVSLKYMSEKISLYSLWVQEIMDNESEYSSRVENVYKYLSSHGVPVIHTCS